MGNTVLYFDRDVTLERIREALEDYYGYDIVEIRGDARDLYGLVLNRHIITVSNRGTSKAEGNTVEENFEIVFEQMVPEEFSKLECTLSEFIFGKDPEDMLELVEGPKSDKSLDLLSSRDGFIRLVGDYSDYNCCAFRSKLYTDLYDMFGGLAVVDDSLALEENIYYRK